MSKSKKADNGAANTVSDRRARLQARIDAVKKLLTSKGAIACFSLLAIGIAFMFSGAAGTSLAMCAGAKYALLYASPDGSVKSGRAGSVVYMRNGRRRNFVVPSLVQNDFTQSVRARFGINSNAWSGLTDGERDSWNNAVGFTYVNRFAETKILKGKALYVRLNQNLVNAGAAPITSAPLPTDVVGVETMSLNGSLAAQMLLTFDPSPVAADTVMVIMATMPLPAGYSRPSASKYRIINIAVAAAASPYTTALQYAVKFGTPPLGSKVFYKVYVINLITGQASPANITSATISL